jgi:hypothetical protein
MLCCWNLQKICLVETTLTGLFVLNLHQSQVFNLAKRSWHPNACLTKCGTPQIRLWRVRHESKHTLNVYIMLELHITYVTKKSKIISKCIGPWCSINRLYTNKLVHFYPTVDNLWHVCLLVFAPKGGGGPWPDGWSRVRQQASLCLVHSHRLATTRQASLCLIHLTFPTCNANKHSLCFHGPSHKHHMILLLLFCVSNSE